MNPPDLRDKSCASSDQVGASEERLRTALGDVYAYHRATEAMMTRVLADAREHPVVQPYHEHWRRAAEMLAGAWPARRRRRTLLEAGDHARAELRHLAHACTRARGLSQEQAVEVAARLACEAC